MHLQPPPVLGECRQGSQVELELQVPADASLIDGPFSGHFPELPVLPGVIQLHWAVELAHRYLQTRPAFRELIGVKFQKVIHPGQRLNLVLEFDAERGELRFRYHAAGATYSSGKLRLADTEAADA